MKSYTACIQERLAESLVEETAGRSGLVGQVEEIVGRSWTWFLSRSGMKGEWVNNCSAVWKLSGEDCDKIRNIIENIKIITIQENEKKDETKFKTQKIYKK